MKKAKLIILIGMGFAGLAILVLLVYQQYLSTDARYARDNLEYLTTRMSKITESVEEIDMDGYQIMLWPQIRTLQYLRDYANTWTDSTIGAYQDAVAAGTLDEDVSLETIGPYDTLARLMLEANDDYIQIIYDELQLDATLTAEESLKLSSIYSEDFENELTTYNNKANEALAQLQKQCMITIAFGFSLITVSLVELRKVHRKTTLFSK